MKKAHLPLSEEKIRANITNKSLQNINVFTYDITDSTNTRAREHYRAGGKMPAVFIAKGQSAGRGRRGRSFDSEPGAGLYISFLFSREKDTDLLTVEAAVKCARVISELCGISVGIKWVNDLFISDRKLGGILAEGELDSSGAQCCAILGIGINLFDRTFPLELADIATSVEAEGGRVPDINLLAARLTEEFFRSEPKAQLLDEYRNLSTVIGKQVRARRILGGEFDCTVLAVKDSGALLVRHSDGTEEELISAEVSIRKNNK